MQKPRDSDTDAWHALGMHRLCGELTLTDNQREVANIVEESGQVLLQSIDDIPDYSNLTSGKFSISSHAVCVASIIPPSSAVSRLLYDPLCTSKSSSTRVCLPPHNAIRFVTARLPKTSSVTRQSSLRKVSSAYECPHSKKGRTVTAS